MMIISTFILLSIVSNIVSCRPSTRKSNKLQAIGFQKAEEDKRYEACFNDMDLNELCERCMKITTVQNDDVFAMCCNDEDDAQQFCKNYVFYGIT
jgi:hypothetical protein